MGHLPRCAGGWKHWDFVCSPCAGVEGDGGDDQICQPFALEGSAAAEAQYE